MRWVRVGLLLAAAWIVGVFAAGFTLNRLIVIWRTYNEVASRALAATRASSDLQVSLTRQLESYTEPARFLEFEGQVATISGYLLSSMGDDDRELVSRFVELHRRVGQSYRQGRFTGGRAELGGAIGLDLLLTAQERGLTELAREIAGRIETHKQAQTADLAGKAQAFGFGLLVALALVVRIYRVICKTLKAASLDESAAMAGAGFAV